MNVIVRWFLERKVNSMLETYKAKIEGYKTYAVQILAILIAIVSFIWGPVDVGTMHLPKIEFRELLEILQIGGGLSFLRMALKKKGGVQ